MYRSGWGPGGFLFHGVHADAGFDESQCLDAVDTHILVGMVRVLAHQFDAAVVFGFLDVFHRDVLLAVDVDRQQIHVAPEDVADVVQLLVEDDVAAFEQRIHRIAHDVDRAVAFGEVGDVDEIDGFELRLVAEQRHEPRRPSIE